MKSKLLIPFEALRRRLRQLKLPIDPAWGLDPEEIRELVLSTDDELVAWAVTLKLNPPVDDAFCRSFASFLESQTPVYDREIMKDISPNDCWIGMVKKAAFK